MSDVCKRCMKQKDCGGKVINIAQMVYHQGVPYLRLVLNGESYTYPKKFPCKIDEFIPIPESDSLFADFISPADAYVLDGRWFTLKQAAKLLPKGDIIGLKNFACLFKREMKVDFNRKLSIAR